MMGDQDRLFLNNVSKQSSFYEHVVLANTHTHTYRPPFSIDSLTHALCTMHIGVYIILTISGTILFSCTIAAL